MMMKRVLLSVSVIAVMVLSQAASADDRRNRRSFGSSNYASHSNHGYSSNRYNRYNPYHYGSSNRRGDNYFSFSYGNRYSRYRRHDSADFVGGLVLGSILSYPWGYDRAYDTSRGRVVYRAAPAREVIYLNESANSNPTAAAGGRRLLRDLEGNCFEVNIDEEGNEIRVQLDAAECDF
ncbi:MAG: hypothetical protein HQ498_01355 [Pseudohongiella sp.]|nr:hypothetical protein [Pseudohongiella sp.]